MRTDKTVLRAIAKSLKQIDTINSLEISELDQFYIDTARKHLLKVLAANGFKLDPATYRIKKLQV